MLTMQRIAVIATIAANESSVPGLIAGMTHPSNRTELIDTIRSRGRTRRLWGAGARVVQPVRVIRISPQAAPEHRTRTIV